jgi:hypothetical protein
MPTKTQMSKIVPSAAAITTNDPVLYPAWMTAVRDKECGDQEQQPLGTTFRGLYPVTGPPRKVPR